MKIARWLIALAVVVAASIPAHAQVWRSGTWSVAPDTGYFAPVWYLAGDTLGVPPTDSLHSIAIPSFDIESFGVQVQFFPIAPDSSSFDSAGVRIYWEQSNDGVHWVGLDTLIVTDTAAVFATVTLAPYGLLRQWVAAGVEGDSTGVTGRIIITSVMRP